MSDSTLKVTDKRMFTPEGELREEYRGRQEAPPPRGEPDRAEPRAPGPSAPPPVFEGDSGFYELLAALAEPAALYLGDATLPDGTLALDLELARGHIDLLGVLQAKTEGNLTQEESAALEEVLYRLRMRYVQKRG